MKIKPIILCGGAGTRLWPESKNNTPKQFIDFGGWTLLKKTLERIKDPVFDSPIISTNSKYLSLTKKFLSKYKIRKYTIVLEPFKKNTAAAILSSTLLKEIAFQQPIVFFPSDHLIEKTSKFISQIKKNRKNLNNDNIFIFGIKPNVASSQYGYILSKKTSKKLNKVDRFIEKPSLTRARKILKKAPGLIVRDEPENGGYPMPWDVDKTVETFVGRIREDFSHPKGLTFWVVADQLYKGAALNSLQIAEVLVSGQ